MTRTDIAKFELDYNGEMIRGKADMLSLTDMWRASGSPANREPKYWLRQDHVREFLDVLAAAENVTVDHLLASRPGRSGGTWAHWQIGLAYAKYLSPEFHMWCNEVVRSVMEGGRVEPDHHGAELSMGDLRAMLAETIAVVLPQMVDARIAEMRFGIVEGVTAGDVLDIGGFNERRGFRGLAQFVSRRLERYHLTRGIPMREGKLGSSRARLFDPKAAREWMQGGGKAIIERWIADRSGQGVLRLVRK